MSVECKKMNFKFFVVLPISAYLSVSICAYLMEQKKKPSDLRDYILEIHPVILGIKDVNFSVLHPHINRVSKRW
jgi:hypothetical protein